VDLSFESPLPGDLEACLGWARLHLHLSPKGGERGHGGS